MNTQMDIVTALEEIRDSIDGTELPLGIWENIKNATDYLHDKLQLTPVQCCIVAKVMESPISWFHAEQICHFIDWELQDVILAHDDVDILVARGFLYPSVQEVKTWRGVKRVDDYMASDALANAVRTDGIFQTPWEQGHTTSEFWANMHRIFARFSSAWFRNETRCCEIKRLMERNSNLKCCSTLLAQNLNHYDLELLLLVTCEFLIKGYEELSPGDYRDYIPEHITDATVDRFRDKTSELYTKDLLAASGDDCDFFCLTQHAKDLLLGGNTLSGLLDDNDTSATANSEMSTIDNKPQQDIDLKTFWDNIDQILDEREYKDTYAVMESRMKSMVYSCQHLECCRNLLKQDLNNFDFVFLLILCSRRVSHDFKSMDFDDYYRFTHVLWRNIMSSQINDKTSDLIRKDLIKTDGDNEHEFLLTDHAMDLFVDPELIQTDDDDDEEFDIDEWLEDDEEDSADQ